MIDAADFARRTLEKLKVDNENAVKVPTLRYQGKDYTVSTIAAAAKDWPEEMQLVANQFIACVRNGHGIMLVYTSEVDVNIFDVFQVLTPPGYGKPSYMLHIENENQVEVWFYGATE